MAGDALGVDVGDGVLKSRDDNVFKGVDSAVRHLDDLVKDDESGL